MPLRLSNPVIHLVSIFRPTLLRPDIRVPTIAHVDFTALRKAGFNSVVIDKDNCLTLPHHDELYAPLREVWSRVLAAFEPGRVLVVSNSSGSSKDPGGIAAEHLSLQLGTPVLLHGSPKPSCAPDIIPYFQFRLPRPTTLRSLIRSEASEARQVVEEDEEEVVRRWRKDVEDGPLLGIHTESKVGKQDPGLEGRMNQAQAPIPPEKQRQDSSVNRTQAPRTKTVEKDEEKEGSVVGENDEHKQAREDLRIIVIGDRLFTDMILAHRLSLYLPRPNNARDQRVISIQTTQLPDPSEARLLRWIENKLSRRRIKLGQVDWGRYVFDPQADSKAEIRSPGVRRWWDIKGRIDSVPRLDWRDRDTWTPAPIVLALGRRVGLIGRGIVRGTVGATRWAWARIQARRRIEIVEDSVEKPSIVQLDKGRSPKTA
ncbi:mitochondrial PGP phosphatase-domain-containing protein [Naematelia encephala]|uniref:Mitochondrial PGP phosphatase-domain-containing protein n=1 Tax=Naematelia encephala TaxID=71784 RepID=A0A1Y2B4J0_9TREE|nr:mitochondrial PGP phosphatase-domain-containing protein [Naematelia encephala]